MHKFHRSGRKIDDILLHSFGLVDRNETKSVIYIKKLQCGANEDVNEVQSGTT